MATSTQVVNRDAVVLNDLDLLIVLGMMIDEMHTTPNRYAPLIKTSSEWIRLREHYGPGTLDLGIDKISEEPSARNAFRELLASIEERWLAGNRTIDASTLNARWRVRGVKFSACETRRLADLMKKLGSLLEE